MNNTHSKPAAVVVNADPTQPGIRSGMLAKAGSEAHTRDLRASEERYRNVFTTTPDGIWVHGEDGAILDANETMCLRIGLSREALLGRNVREFITPESAARLGENVRDAIEGQPCIFETTYLSTTGTVVEVEVHERRIPWGDRTAILCISRDITERRRAAEALMASEMRFQGMLRDVATVAVQGYAMDGTVRYWNRASETFYGYTAEEAIGRNLLDLIIPPAMRDGVSAAIRRMAETGETPPASELALMRKDGSLVPIYSSHALVRVPGRDLELFCIDIDLTERKQADAQLRLQSLVLNQIQDCVTITDLNGVITYVNDAEVRALGYSRDELIGGTTEKYGENPDRGATQRQILEETLKHGAWRGDVVNRTVDGKRVILDCRTQTILDEQGNKVALAGVATDITERENLQTQLGQAQKMESIGRLAGGVAHDFNNMLQYILGIAELGLDRVRMDDPLRSELEDIRKAALRTADLTHQLLAFARRQIVAPKVLDLNETVANMLALLRRLIGENIDLVWKPGADLWPVRMDPAQVDSILANLCVNARDAISGTGRIVVETVNAVLDADYCSRHTGCLPGDYVLVVVRDDGCGMAVETLAQLFEPFFTTKEPGKGTGLGLSSVHGAVAQNGGSIDVSSKPGAGTTFRIYLPRHLAGIAPETENPKTRSAGGGETILLVEDEPGILEIAARMLTSMGYTVVAAATPGEAIRMAREYRGRVDLLITDVVMPEMNGRDLAKNLLAIHPDIRRLFMSGYTADIIAHQGVLDEGVHFIQKPFARTELAAKLREVFV